tara:strand:+ start:7468 stop:9990 length:2523 start_codon:yes stop_codon:yes gene_type:complete
MDPYLSSKGYAVYKNNITESQLLEIKKDLTVTPKVCSGYGNDEPESFSLYKENKSKIYMPYYYGRSKFGKPIHCKFTDIEKINIKFKKEMRDYQKIIINSYKKEAQNKGGGIISVGCGRGKCLAYNTPILMYNGKIKYSQNILIGDKIMGDDNTVRNVLSITSGYEDMYEIIYNNNSYNSIPESYTVNASHILSLKKIKSNLTDLILDDEIYDIKVSDFIKLPIEEQNKYLGFKTPIIFSDKNTKIDPYIYGYKYAYQKKNNTIPYEYKCNCQEKQLKLLAGLIESKFINNYCIFGYNYLVLEINDIYKRLLNDILYLVRSLGFYCYSKKIKKYNIKHIQIFIIGSRNKILEIPLKYNNFTNNSNSNINDNYNDYYKHLVYRIKIKKRIDNPCNRNIFEFKDKYYGFEIDGNRRFVLGDFTVTHNTVMALKIIEELNMKTLILVHKEFLMNQWKERIEEFLPDAKIGYLQGKTLAVKNKDIVLGMIQSLSNPKKDKDYPKEVFDGIGLLIADECHHLGAKQFSRVLQKYTFKFTLGLSATPNRLDGLAKVFKYFLGDICYRDKDIKKSKEELALQHIPDAEVYTYMYYNIKSKFCQEILNYRKKPNTISMETKLSQCPPRNNFILSILKSLVLENRKILILSSRRDHIFYLEEEIIKRQIADGSVGLYLGGMKQDDLDESTLKQIIIATFDMAEEAFDCKALDTLILATPKKNIIQAVGRIMRKKKSEREKIPKVIDISDTFSNFKRWNNEREKYYKKQKYVIYKFKYNDDINMDVNYLFNNDNDKIICDKNDLNNNIFNNNKKIEFIEEINNLKCKSINNYSVIDDPEVNNIQNMMIKM